MVDDQHPAHAHLEVYDTKDGLWHPELGDVTQPDDWDFLPAGDAYVTRRVKAAGDYWMLYQPKGRRAHRRVLGLLAPSNAIAAARTAADDTLSRRQTQRVAGARQRDRKEAAYQVEFERAVLAWLDFAPEHVAVAGDIARNAVDRATVVGSGRVGRTKTLGLEDRAALAARAYIRHHYTEYEQQLVAVDVVDFDDDGISFDSAGDYREIKRAAHQAVDDFLERHRTLRNNATLLTKSNHQGNLGGQSNGAGGVMQVTDVERIVAAFTDATNRHDVEEMLALVSDDVVFEGTTPPDGVRIEGDKASLRALWEGIFRDSPNAVVETQELIACGDRCTALLRYVFDAERPNDGHVRAVDVLRVVDGKITEKLSYVKG